MYISIFYKQELLNDVVELIVELPSPRFIKGGLFNGPERSLGWDEVKTFHKLGKIHFNLRLKHVYTQNLNKNTSVITYALSFCLFSFVFIMFHYFYFTHKGGRGVPVKRSKILI